MSKTRLDRFYLYAVNNIRIALNKQVLDALSNFDPEAAIMVNRSILIPPIVDIWVKVGTISAGVAYRDVKTEKDFDPLDFLQSIWREKIRKYAQQYAYRISNELSLTTKKTIQQAIGEGKEMKLNNTQLKEYILEKTSAVNESRAANIARTESTSASNYGKNVGAESYFSDTAQTGYKYWVHLVSEHPRHSHEIMAEQKPIPMNQKFNVNGELMDYPGDINASAKNRCNCKCTVNYISEAVYLRRYGN